MSKSLKIADESVYNDVCTEARLLSRSFSGQAEHWIKIGRAIERSADFTYDHIKSALAGGLSPDALSAKEQTVYFDKLSDLMWEVSPEEEQFFANRKLSGLGAGLDNNGKVITQSVVVNS